MELKEIEYLVQTVIPHIEKELADSSKSKEALLELYTMYEEVLRTASRDDFISFNKYLELEEDHTVPNKAFFHHRRGVLSDIFKALNDMEIYDKYDRVLIMMPPRVGKTTTGIRFMAWIGGRYPERTQLSTSYSDNITKSFYNGVMEIVESDQYKNVFYDSPLVAQNSKREEIWLKTVKRYPSLMFIPIEGSMTGRGEASDYLYCDDLVSGLEQALSVVRLDKLWGTYTVNARQRKLDGAKEIHVATPWSVHDPITKLAMEYGDDPRTKIIKKPCYDEDGESAFDFFGGFSTNYYKDLQRGMDDASFSALYLQEPIEREGLLYHDDELKYYFDLPNERPDTIVSICDSKNLGKDYVASPVAYIYGEDVYIEDVVYNDGLPEVTRPAVADKWVEHKVIRADVEMNNGGNYYAEDLDELIKEKGGKTSLRLFFSSNNKNTKIITYSDFVKKRFIFKDKSKYNSNSDYAKFMRDVFRWTQTGKNPHDDAPDSLAMLAQLVQDLEGNSIKILDRRTLRL